MIFAASWRRHTISAALLVLLATLINSMAPAHGTDTFLTDDETTVVNPGLPDLGPLHNTFVKLTRDKKLKVIVIGNSVTHGAPAMEARNPSFYTAMETWFKARFPDAYIEVKPKIIFAIGPEVQLFRMDENVLAEKPDLVLAEFGAANGAWGDAGRAVTEPATEGYLRRLRFLSPKTDCLLQLGLFKTMMEVYNRKEIPGSVTFIRGAGAKYNCAVSDAQAELVRRILAGEPWETFMKDYIHPTPMGYEVHSATIVAELERQYTRFKANPDWQRVVQDHRFPASTLHAEPWLFPRLVPAYFAQQRNGFEVSETAGLKYLKSTEAQASGRFTAPGGRIVGVLMRSPEKRGNLEIRDGNRWVRLAQKTEPRFTEVSDPKNYLQRNFFAPYGLPADKDTVEFRVSPEPETAGAFAVQIVGFLVIERPAAIDFTRP